MEARAQQLRLVKDKDMPASKLFLAVWPMVTCSGSAFITPAALDFMASRLP
jgi:hypothetical protein